MKFYCYFHTFYRLIVQKEGPNKGRPFYNCPKGRDSTCNFFKWGDVDVSVNMNERTDSGNSGNRRNSNFKPKGNRSTSNRSQGTRAKRKCGICGTEGWYFIKQIKIEVYINVLLYF